MLGPWLSLAMFYIFCFLKSGAVNRKWLGMWLLDDQVEDSTKSSFSGSASTFAFAFLLFQ
jgi:hypothetical protein